MVYALNLCLTAIIALMAWRAGPSARPLSVAILVLCCAAVLARPAVGVYVCAFFTILGDSFIAWWFPFAKNFSSYESALYVHDALIVSPLEVVLVTTLAAWWLQVFGGRAMPVSRGRLLKPLAVFTAVIAFAFLHGVLTGGDVAVALWEVRPIAYLPLMYVLTTSLLDDRAQYRRLVFTVVAAMLLEALHARYVIATMPDGIRIGAQVMGYLEHSASLHFNMAVVLLLAGWLFRARFGVGYLLLITAVVAIVPVYLAAERRSAVVALAAAIILLALVLHGQRRAAFWYLVPAVTVFSVIYLAAFWNGQGGLAFPAQAVKSVLAPESLSAADQGSNLYRQIETYNIVETVKAYPLLGSGFGHPFLRILPLPYIPFVWADYFPHNSILWIWMNTGIGGFLAMLWLFAVAVLHGVRKSVRAGGQVGALVLGSVLFIVMYVVYAYVDIGWDTQSMIFLAVALAVIDGVGPDVEREQAMHRSRRAPTHRASAAVAAPSSDTAAR